MSVDEQRQIQQEQARNQETTAAQQQAQQQAQANAQSPLIDMRDANPGELLKRLTDADVDGDQYEGLSDLLSPFLSSTQMLASHDGDEYYDDLSHELLNENLADRIIASRERGAHLTDDWLEIARDVEHEQGVVKSRPLGPTEKEAIRSTLEKVRTDRQSLGDGTFLSSITEMHVSSEVRRDDETDDSGGGLLSTINPF